MRKTARQHKKASPKRLEAVYIEGKAFCPLCRTRHFSGIREYALADYAHKDMGMFKFIVQCSDCKNFVVYYKDL